MSCEQDEKQPWPVLYLVPGGMSATKNCPKH
jgi:hypothetical protein